MFIYTIPDKKLTEFVSSIVSMSLLNVNLYTQFIAQQHITASRTTTTSSQNIINEKDGRPELKR